ncbi:MAG: radical SAM protein [bacterium]|nr:radical SAM protein [bacterium]
MTSENRIINRTSAYCRKCSVMHDAELIRKKDEIWGRIACPDGEQNYLLSTDADFFITNRNKSFYAEPGMKERIREKKLKQKVYVSFLDITNDCNFHCPVCYADSGKKKNPLYIAESDLKQRLKRLKEIGVSSVVFFGGEPSMHPQICDFVKIARTMGLKPIIITNGYLLGTDPVLVNKLKRAGIHQIHIQFDTFNEVTHQKIRGNKFIAEKLKAIENVINARIGLKLVVTVTRFNLAEIPDILNFALSLGPSLKEVLFQGVIKEGRYLLKSDDVIDRELILNTLVNSEPFKNNLSQNDFWPIPGIASIGLYMHPDCVIMGAVYKFKKNIKVAGRIIDLSYLFEKTQKNKGTDFIARFISLPFIFLKSLKFSTLFYLLAYLKDFIFRTKIVIDIQKKINTAPDSFCFVLIAIEAYNSAMFQDVEKTNLCPSKQILKDTEVCACIYNSRNMEHPNSRKSLKQRDEL